ncbi:hypothetical protein EVAR_85647_1 [Eumeta japonica]|uniref:Uncharacterized protein n=1 Tax=Eumeta variegata TaxID=151549 RepID=A0A4C1XTQ6_EUMVA|nr:hypothetical protein EVAR_85647_1 [Eumeta japonica]
MNCPFLFDIRRSEHCDTITFRPSQGQAQGILRTSELTAATSRTVNENLLKLGGPSRRRGRGAGAARASLKWAGRGANARRRRRSLTFVRTHRRVLSSALYQNVCWSEHHGATRSAPTCVRLYGSSVKRGDDASAGRLSTCQFFSEVGGRTSRRPCACSARSVVCAFDPVDSLSTHFDRHTSKLGNRAVCTRLSRQGGAKKYSEDDRNERPRRPRPGVPRAARANRHSSYLCRKRQHRFIIYGLVVSCGGMLPLGTRTKQLIRRGEYEVDIGQDSAVVTVNWRTESPPSPGLGWDANATLTQ